MTHRPADEKRLIVNTPYIHTVAGFEVRRAAKFEPQCKLTDVRKKKGEAEDGHILGSAQKVYLMPKLRC